MTKLYRVLGKRGRITIPFEIRQRVGFTYNDVLSFTESSDGRTVTVIVTLDPGDMGKVIGRQGKVAKALRALVRAGSAKENKRYNIEIKERGEE